ncbi:hypothetical protein EDB84DRAFT_121795 [Lactarius hengduanensis]|nr:hypothetical protein EDB84DRAFT_121795 [Lactarius hengduanensis]
MVSKSFRHGGLAHEAFLLAIAAQDHTVSSVGRDCHGTGCHCRTHANATINSAPWCIFTIVLSRFLPCAHTVSKRFESTSTLFSATIYSSHQLPPDRFEFPPVTRTVLPALTSFEFHATVLRTSWSRSTAPNVQHVRFPNFSSSSIVQKTSAG